MKKIIKVVMLMAVVVSVVPSTALAALMPVGMNASSSSDSDGVSYTSYSIGTAKEDIPWNYTYSHLKIRDLQGRVVDENAFTVKWHRPINDEAGIAAWLGYTNNNIWKFTNFGVMYNGVVNYTDKVVLNYGHDSVPTVAAYSAHIMSNSLSGRYQHEISKGLMLEANMKYARYSDDNARKAVGVNITKDFGTHYRLGLAYSYDTTDINRAYNPPDNKPYYMPQGQSALSIVPEVALPIGDGTLVMSASKSLSARNIKGAIHSKTYRVGYHLNNLYIGTAYYHDDTPYWSHDTSFSWNMRW